MLKLSIKSIFKITNRFYYLLSIIGIVVAFGLSSVDMVRAADVTLGLGSYDSAQISGIRIYYKTGSSGSPYNGTDIDQGGSPITVSLDSLFDPQHAEIQLTGLQEEITYFFVATVYDAHNNESRYSNEVSYTPQAIHPEIFKITTSSTGNGTITPNGTQSMEHGQDKTFQFIPDPDYHVVDVLIDGYSAGPLSTYIFTNIDADHTLRVLFEKNAGNSDTSGNGESKNVKLWYEAEDADFALPIVPSEDPDASAGSYMWVPDGMGNIWNPFSDDGLVQISFEVPAAGDYFIWGRVMTDSSSDNSFFVSLDNETPMVWQTKISGPDNWTWDALGTRTNTMSDADTCQPTSYWLEPGRHTIVFGRREDGTKLDKILITNDLAFLPQGHGQLPASAVQTIWLEAEDGESQFPMMEQTDPNASAGGYMWVPNGMGSNWSPSGTGGVQISFDVPVAGDYHIWARIMANSRSDNSFFVSLDNETPIAWLTKVGGPDNWTWDAVGTRTNTMSDADTCQPTSYWLEPGRHTIVFGRREDGTKLDKILITNDLTFLPQGLGQLPASAVQTIWTEAENGESQLPMMEQTDPNASAGSYMWVPNGMGSNWSPSGTGGVQISFDVPVAGDYHIWARIMANSRSDNSFFVSLDNETPIAWLTKVGGPDNWTWDAVGTRTNTMSDADTCQPTSYWLEPGRHTIVFGRREDGTKLDKILITNDFKYLP